MKKITLLVAFLLSFVGYAQLSEDFESGTFPPTGWQVYNNGVGSPTLNWAASTTSTFLCTQGSNSPTVAYMNRETGIPAGQNAEDWLITKVVDLTGITYAQLRFWNKMTLAGVNGTNYKIYVKSTPGAPTSIADFPSTPFAQWSEDDFYDGVIDSNPGITPFNMCFEKVLNLNVFANQQIYIAFVMDLPGGSNSRDRWVLDDIKVEPICFDPTALTVPQIETTLTTATLHFTPNTAETQWEYILMAPGAPAPTSNDSGITFTIPTAPPYEYTITTGLTVDTNYEVYIRANCIFGTYSSNSAWVGPVAFKTRKYGEKCEAPITVLPSALPYQTNDNTSTYLNDYSGSAGGCGTAGNYLNGNDVAYQITPDFTGFLNIRLTPATSADQGSGVFVYTSCANVGNTCLAGVSNGGSGVRLISNLPVTAGTTYTIIISSLGSGSSPVSVDYNLFIERVYCDAPLNIVVPAATITNDTAVINWDAGTATSWQVAVQPADGDNPPVAPTYLATVSSPTYTANPLNHTTEYEVLVRAACGDGTFSPWTNPVKFVTKCGTYTTPYTETFNSTPVNSLSEACWSVVNTNGGQAWSMNYVFNPYEGNHSASLNTATGSTHDDWLISPKLNITSNKRIRFRYRVGVATAASGFEMKLSTTGTAPSDFATVILPVATYTNVEYLEKIVYLNAYSGDVYVSFHVPNGIGGTTGSRIYIDEVIFEDIPACPMPLAPSASAPTIDGATLAWTQGFQETNWDIVVQAPTAAAPTATTTPTHTSTAPTLAVTGLANGTDYCYYVRANCGATQSEWVGPVCFKTLLCNVADKCNYVFSMTDTGANGWNGNTMNVVQDGDIIAVIGGTFTAGAGPINVSVPLCPNEPFSLVWNAAGTNPDQVAVTIFDPYNEEVYVKNAGDGFQGTTLHTSVVDCNPPLCLKPQNLTCPPATVTQTTAVIGWTEMGTATLWEYYVQPQGDPPPTSGILTNGTPAPAAPVYTENVGSLTPATLYEFWVRAVCGGANGNSDWKGPFKFVTKSANDECLTAISVPVNADLNCTLVTPGTVIGSSNSGAPTSTCGGTADDDVWFKFTATSQAHIISLNNITGSTTDLSHAVYSGTCGSLALVYCDVNNSSYYNTYTIGQTYYLRIWTAPTLINQTSSFEVCIGKVLPPLFVEASSLPTAPTTYTVPQLVNDVLVTSPCGIVSNITYSTGTNFSNGPNGIGYFNKNGSGFGLDEGIILATRSANTCSGPNTTGSEGAGTWPGDTQLFNYIQGLGIDTGLSSYNNSSVLEFDFVPIADQVKFDFIFASDEYGTFQCSYSDAFAFFLTNTTTGVTTNLALIPGVTPPTPVAVTTIRDNLYNSGCGSVNEDFFDLYYGTPNGLNNLVDPINFNGYTVPMTASGTVTPGQTYHMKFVVGDRNDSSFDSAVFLSKFDIGSVDLGDDLTVTADNALCAGQTYTINSGLTAPPYEFTWFVKAPGSSTFEEIVGQTGATLTVTAPGEYKLTAHYVGSACVGEDIILVEFYPDLTLATPEPNDISICTGTPSFDLTQNDAVVIAGLTNPGNYQVTYYTSETDAQNATNPIANPTAYVNTSNPQTIWVRIYNTVSFCSGIKNFEIQVIAPPTADIDYGTAPFCNMTGTASVTFTGTTGGTYSIAGSPANISVDANGTVTWTPAVVAGTYTINYAIGSGSCSASDSATIEITTQKVADFAYNATSICKFDANPTLSYLLGGQAGVFSVSPSGLTLDASTGAIDLSTSSAGVYTITNFIAASGGCPSDTHTFELTVTDILSASIDYGTASFCNTTGTASVTFAGTTGGTYSIAGSPANISVDANGTVTWTPAVVAGTYTINYNVGTGSCAGSDSATIEITTQKVADFAYSVTSICKFDANPTLSYLNGGQAGVFSVTPSGLTLDASTGAIDLSTSAANVYTITNFIAASGGCPEDTHTFELTVTDKPTATISYGSVAYCSTSSSASVTLTGASGGTYSTTATEISVNATTGEVTWASTVVPGTYTINYSVGSGNCISDPISTTITINPELFADFTYSDTSYCKNGINPAPVYSGGGQAGTFSSTPSGVVFTGTAGEIDLAATPAGTYIIRNTVDIATDGCPAVFKEQTVKIVDLPTASFSYVVATTGTNKYCKNLLEAVKTGFSGFATGTYSVQGSPANISVDANGKVTWNNSVAIGVYTIEYTMTAAPCAPQTVTATIEIVDSITPSASFNYNTSYCYNDANSVPSGTFTSGTFSATPAGLSINATTGEINIANSAPGTYEVKYTIVANPSLCILPNSATDTVTIGNEIEVSLAGDCVNNSFTLSASPVNNSFVLGSAVYTFSPMVGTVGSNPWEFKPTQTGIYTVSVNVGGCIGVASFTVENISCNIQKGISPNGDGKNDSFDLRGMNVSHLTIYNRYGKQVYTRFNYANEWSGQTSEGDELPDGTYYYMIERTNGESLTGWVYINRSN